MSVLSRPSRLHPRSKTAETPAGIPQQPGTGSRPTARGSDGAGPSRTQRRRRAALVLAGLLAAAAVATGVGIAALTSGGDEATLAPGILTGTQESNLQRDEAARRRAESADGFRATQPQPPAQLAPAQPVPAQPLPAQ